MPTYLVNAPTMQFLVWQTLKLSQLIKLPTSVLIQSLCEKCQLSYRPSQNYGDSYQHALNLYRLIEWNEGSYKQNTAVQFTTKSRSSFKRWQKHENQ